MSNSSQGFGVAGEHLHFIDSERKLGGHVLEVHATQVSFHIAVASNVHIELPTSEDFNAAKLVRRLKHKIPGETLIIVTRYPTMLALRKWKAESVKECWRIDTSLLTIIQLIYPSLSPSRRAASSVT